VKELFTHGLLGTFDESNQTQDIFMGLRAWRNYDSLENKLLCVSARCQRQWQEDGAIT
jgi:hypothetical protein